MALLCSEACCGMATGGRDNGNDRNCHQVVLSYSKAYKGIKSQDNPSLTSVSRD